MKVLCVERNIPICLPTGFSLVQFVRSSRPFILKNVLERTISEDCCLKINLNYTANGGKGRRKLIWPTEIRKAAVTAADAAV